MIKKKKINFIFLFFLVLTNIKVSGQFENKSFKINKLPFNSKFSDKNPAFYKKGIVFSSNRKDDIGVIYYNKKTGEYFSDLFYTKILSNNKWQKPKPLNKVVNSKNNEGKASFTQNDSIISFTRGDISKEDANKKTLKILKAKKEDEKWGNIETFPFNSDEYNTAHPSFSVSGKTLIFVSDMPGGYGGTDLYVTYKKEGKWTKPLNLGPEINSEYNEISPFIHKSGRLFYSSNKKENGIGGYDIYTAYFFKFGGNNPWKKPKNLGRPFNTSADDFGFIAYENYNTGFFTSNRNNKDQKNDDIYIFRATQNVFSSCDSLDEVNLCNTFYEKGSVKTDSMPLIYEWKMGDGTKKNGLKVHHCYEKPGTYIIQLNVVDIITDEVYFNEATYKLNIDSINTAYIQSPDTLFVNQKVDFKAGLSNIPECEIENYRWNMGDGNVRNGKNIKYQYQSEGEYRVQLSVIGQDSIFNPCKSCVYKKIYVKKQSEYKKSTLNYSQLITNIAKPVYKIKDRSGNSYRIQIATSDKPLNIDSMDIEEKIGEVKEYKDRDIYGYTVGNYDDVMSSFPELKKIHEKGFKEAVVIAMKEGKVVSGNDSSFYTNLPDNFVPVKVVRLKGKVVNEKGEPIPAKIKWEELVNNKFHGSVKCDRETGKYSIDFTDGFFYGYYASLDNYYPVSNYLDLRGENDLSELQNNITMIKIDTLIETSQTVRLNNIFFDYGEYKLKPESFPELKRIARIIKQRDNIKVQISGHTDSTGSKRQNMVLSQKRAMSVKSYLISLGCKKDKLKAKGYGESQPLMSNKSKRGRKLNRRVELKFINNKNNND